MVGGVGFEPTTGRI